VNGVIVTVTTNQFLTALIGRPAPGDILLEDGTGVLLMEDDTSLLTEEISTPWLQGISADPNDPDWIELYSAKLVRVGDPLYVKIQLALGYTSAQMLELFESAVQVPR
jgi:hypothetical protein